MVPVGVAIRRLVIRGVPNPIIAGPQVSVPLISRPVVCYGKGGTTPILEPRISLLWWLLVVSRLFRMCPMRSDVEVFQL